MLFFSNLNVLIKKNPNLSYFNFDVQIITGFSIFSMAMRSTLLFKLRIRSQSSSDISCTKQDLKLVLVKSYSLWGKTHNVLFILFGPLILYWFEIGFGGLFFMFVYGDLIMSGNVLSLD
jgi:hypothetical protein